MDNLRVLILLASSDASLSSRYAASLFEARKTEEGVDVEIVDGDTDKLLATRVDGVWWQHFIVEDFQKKYPKWRIAYISYDTLASINIAQDITIGESWFQFLLTQNKYGEYSVQDISQRNAILMPELCRRLSDGLYLAALICVALKPKESDNVSK